MVWSLNGCYSHKSWYFTRNIFNQCVEGFKILFEASSQASSATLTTIWRPGLIMATPYLQRRLFQSPQCAEEFIKSFQFSLVTTLSRFWVSQGKEGLCAKQKSSRIGLINTTGWIVACVMKINTSLRSEFIFLTPATRSLPITCSPLFKWLDQSKGDLNRRRMALGFSV